MDEIFKPLLSGTTPSPPKFNVIVTWSALAPMDEKNQSPNITFANTRAETLRFGGARVQHSACCRVWIFCPSTVVWQLPQLSQLSRLPQIPQLPQLPQLPQHSLPLAFALALALALSLSLSPLSSVLCSLSSLLSSLFSVLSSLFSLLSSLLSLLSSLSLSLFPPSLLHIDLDKCYINNYK